MSYYIWERRTPWMARGAKVYPLSTFGYGGVRHSPGGMIWVFSKDVDPEDCELWTQYRVGFLNWYGNAVEAIDVDREHQLAGIGAGMFDLARTINPLLRHGDQLSPDGAKFKAAMERREPDGLGAAPEPHTEPEIAAPLTTRLRWWQRLGR